jgi:hypothetical protein
MGVIIASYPTRWFPLRANPRSVGTTGSCQVEGNGCDTDRYHGNPQASGSDVSNQHHRANEHQRCGKPNEGLHRSSLVASTLSLVEPDG